MLGIIGRFARQVRQPALAAAAVAIMLPALVVPSLARGPDAIADVAEARSCSAGYHATSLDAPTPAGTPLADHLLTTDCPTTTIDLHDALRQAITHLTDRERLVLRLRFVDELTQTQIGDRIGVSQMQVSRILRTTLTRLRTHLQDTDTTPHTHTPAA